MLLVKIIDYSLELMKTLELFWYKFNNTQPNFIQCVFLNFQLYCSFS
jgi:hypothetical protein